MDIKTIKEELSANSIGQVNNEDLDILSTKLYNTLNWGPISRLELIITESCNLNCQYCFVNKKNKRSMPLGVAKTAINFLLFYSDAIKDLNITIFGGEPLLEIESIYGILDYCRMLEKKVPSKKISFSVTTNGTLITEEILKKIDGRFLLLLSIDGNEKTHNKYRKYRNGNGSFNDVFPKIELIREYQKWLGVRMTVHPNTVEYLSENVKFLFDSGINQFIIGTAYGPIWEKRALLLYEKEMTKISRFYQHNRTSMRITFFEDEDKIFLNVWGCSAGRNSVTIDYDGNIYPCIKFIGLDGPTNFRLGNIYEGITNTNVRNMLATSKSNLYVTCTNCSEKAECKGGCPAENYLENKSIYIPCKSQCELKKIENRVLRKFWEQQKAEV
jgi:uncharacterized protein